MEKHQGRILYRKLFPTNKGGKGEGAGMRSVSALVFFFFAHHIKDQHLVNQSRFYLAKWGISPRTTSKAGQDKVTAVCWGRQHKPWLPNTHTHTTHILTHSSTDSGFGTEPRGACRDCTPHALGQTALWESAAILSPPWSAVLRKTQRKMKKLKPFVQLNPVRYLVSSKYFLTFSPSQEKAGLEPCSSFPHR